MIAATFFDILGIDPNAADRASVAKGLWPQDLLSTTQGMHLPDDDATQVLVNALQASLSFTNVRPGVDAQAFFDAGTPGQIAFSADMAVSGPANNTPFYFRSMPDTGIQLTVTDPVHPAKVYFAQDGRGYEIIIDSLPVKIFLKEGIASSLTDATVSSGDFDASKIDSFVYTLADPLTPAEIDCFVRLQLTPEGDVFIEPTVPLSLGPVRWMGLPATAVYDIQLIPSPNRRDTLEWTHNDIGSLTTDPFLPQGAIGWRSIDVDFTQPPFADMLKRIQTGAVNLSGLEIVLEDVVIPVSVPILPLPSHGTFGFRRKITDRTDITQAYSLAGAPVQIPLNGQELLLEVEEFFFRTGDTNALDPADQPQLLFQSALIFQSSPGNMLGPTVGVDDDWTITAGMVMDPSVTPVKMTIAGTTIGLVGFRFGISIGRMQDKDTPFSDCFELLGDLFVTGTPTGSDTSSFKMRSLTGKPLSLVIKDLGYKLGHFSLDGLEMPNGMQLIFAQNFAIVITEMGWVEDTNGAPYFSFSGGINLGFGGGNSTQPTGAAANNASGFGIRVIRLRFRLNDDSTKPAVKVDGLFLQIKMGGLDVEGFGYISNYTDTGWTVEEMGFGAKVAFGLGDSAFSIAAEYVHGNRKNVSDATQNFAYTLASLELDNLPMNAISLSQIRALYASNLAPNLDSQFPDGEGLALYKWHQEHDDALTVPANRTLADWIAEDDALSLGIGLGFVYTCCGWLTQLNAFVFYSKSKADDGLLIVVEAKMLKNPKPVAFGAIELDFSSGKWSGIIGINFNLVDFVKNNPPSWLQHIASFTGTLYVGNKPGTFALGQLADQTTWLTLKVNFSALGASFVLTVGVCVQIVDGGPKGVGVVLSLAASANWGIGKFTLTGSFGFIIGSWKTGSDSSGYEFWAGLSFKISLFSVLSIGAEINLKITYLGKSPWSRAIHGELKIDTPWFLPDVTFTIDKTTNESLPFDMPLVTQALASSSALDPTSQSSVPSLVPGLSGALGDATFLYSFDQLNGLQGTRFADTHLRTDLVPVSIDSTIVLTFSSPVSNDSLVGGSTETVGPDAGTQTVQDLTIRFGLESVAVRRAPRFGPTAGVWTDFLTDAQTTLTAGGVAPETLTFTWDVDSRADGSLSPARLLMNSAAPYSFTTQSLQNDEEATRNDPDFPCCTGSDTKNAFPRPHALMFASIPLGARTPRSQAFDGAGGALWGWTTPLTPVIAPGDPTFAGGQIARLAPSTSMMIGSVDLADPASGAQLELAWGALSGTLFFEAFDGTTLVAQQSVDLHPAGSTTLVLSPPASDARGFSRLQIRYAAPAVTSPVTTDSASEGNAAIGIFRISYVTLHDAQRYVGILARCKNGGLVGPPGSDASGKLAFLPNYDYEVVLTTAIAVTSKDQGTRTLALSEAAYVRTKGLPGLNSCANVGDDIRLHVASTYPLQRTIPLYRTEPCVLAFDNSLSSVLPIDRTPPVGSPPEKAQMFPLQLNVDRVTSLDGMKRLTVPSNDWISAHRANPLPPPYALGSVFTRGAVRHAPVTDPMVLRFQSVISAVPVCGTQTPDHASQVLLHEPLDATATANPWEAMTGYRATARQQNGPFTGCWGFDTLDLGAFIRQADGGAPVTTWSVDANANLVAPAAAPSGRSYAACGDLNWDHLEARTQIDLRTATAAGIAVGVGDGTPVPQSMLATIEADGASFALVLRARSAAVESELGRAVLAAPGPYTLIVTAYDDTVRATVGEIVVEAPRNAVREGRVALVAIGPAAFAGISVDALDIYAFDFVTSAYASFDEHLGTFDGTVRAMQLGAFGGTPVAVATVLGPQVAAIPTLMTPSADPQARQRSFDAITSALGIGLQKTVTAVTVSRLIDASGTIGLLLESPEQISLVNDVTLTLTGLVRQWIPGPVINPVGPIDPTTATTAAATALATLVKPDTTTAALEALLSKLTFANGRVSVRSTTAFAANDRIVRIVSGTAGNALEIYHAPVAAVIGPIRGLATGTLIESLSVAQAKQQPDLAKVADLPLGAVAVLQALPKAPIVWGRWGEADGPIPFIALANGAETAILIFAELGSTLPAGTSTLHAVLERDRWSATTLADPEQHYQDAHTLTLQW